MKRRPGDYAGYAEVLILLVSGQGGFGFITENSVDRTVVISKARKPGLDCADNSVAVCTRRCIAAVVAIGLGRGVLSAVVRIVAIVVRVAIGVIRVIAIVVAVVGIVIPWIETPPETVDKNKDMTMIKVLRRLSQS